MPANAQFQMMQQQQFPMMQQGGMPMMQQGGTPMMQQGPDPMMQQQQRRMMMQGGQMYPGQLNQVEILSLVLKTVSLNFNLRPIQ